MNRTVSLAGAALLVSALAAGVLYGVSARAPASAQTAVPLLDFPDGTATASETCGACHQGIYKEFSEGFGSDLQWADMKNYPPSEPAVRMLKGVAKGMPRSPSAHAAAGNDPWPLDAIEVEEHGKRCNVCHYPQAFDYPDAAAPDIHRPKPRTADQESGITCASCHLTPDGKVRGPYVVEAPHATIKDDRTRTSVAWPRSCVALSTAPILAHSLTLAARRTYPTTKSASRRFLKHRPNDPPSKPTPTSVTLFQCTAGVSEFAVTLSSAS